MCCNAPLRITTWLGLIPTALTSTRTSPTPGTERGTSYLKNVKATVRIELYFCTALGIKCALILIPHLKLFALAQVRGSKRDWNNEENACRTLMNATSHSTVEGEMLAVWKNNLANGQRVDFSDRYRGLVVRYVMMRSPMKIKVPRGAEAVFPKEGLGLDYVTTEWGKTRDDIGQLVRSLSEFQLNKGYVRHPVSGWMTPEMTLGFLRAHLSHHGFQIRRLERALRATS